MTSVFQKIKKILGFHHGFCGFVEDLKKVRKNSRTLRTQIRKIKQMCSKSNRNLAIDRGQRIDRSSGYALNFTKKNLRGNFTYLLRKEFQENTNRR